MIKTNTKLVLLFFILLSSLTTVAFATIGAAEWKLETPGGHVVSHSDSWKEKHGTCIKEKKGDKIFISKIVWWQYYEKTIVGETDSRYFIFDEEDQMRIFVENENEFKKVLKSLNVGKPLSKRMTPQDGWALVWQYSWAKARLKSGDLEKEQKKELEEIINAHKGKIYEKRRVIYYTH